MESSYKENNFGKILYGITLGYSPKVAVELGVLEGYSTVAISKALLKLEAGHLDSYDLWEDYKYTHSIQSKVQQTINAKGLFNHVTLYKQDAYSVHNKYEKESVNLLHIDISNDGDVLNQMIENWNPKMKKGGIILFEGGSKERDNIFWMTKYNKKPINPEIYKNEIILNNYFIKVFDQFPSLTLLLKQTGEI